MRYIFLALNLFYTSSFADDYRFNSVEHAFIPKHPIFVFELGGDTSKKIRVCYAGLKDRRGQIEFGTAIPDDISDCLSVEAFGDSDVSYIISAVLEGRKNMPGPQGTVEEQVKIKGKTWGMSSDAKVIFRQIKTLPDEYTHICRIELKPVERLREPDAPQKTIFCKAIEPIVAQETDQKGKLRFDEEGKPLMSETMVCPLPANCIKPEWAIEPTMRFMPEEASGTAHALEKGPAVVHKDQRPSMP